MVRKKKVIKKKVIKSKPVKKTKSKRELPKAKWGISPRGRVLHLFTPLFSFDEDLSNKKCSTMAIIGPIFNPDDLTHYTKCKRCVELEKENEQKKSS